MNKKIYAVAGNPIMHSKSPFIFNNLFVMQGVDYHYTRLLTESADEILSTAKQLNFAGLNITAPFKEAIMPFMDWTDEAACAIGCINTIKITEGCLKGYNTDYLGVINSLDLNKIKSCLILGAGGAAKAACYALKSMDKEVFVWNRTYQRANELAEILGVQSIEMSGLEHSLKKVDLVVNTLPSKVKVVDNNWWQTGQIVFDANYNISVYKNVAKNKEMIFISGEEWLLNQAAPAFEILTGNKCSTDEMKGALGIKTNKRIALIGFMGAGKSIIGEKLAYKLGYNFIDSDKFIEQKTGKSIPKLFSEKGESYFREHEKEALNAIINSDCQILSCGGGLVDDFENLETLRKHFFVIYLHVSFKESMKRIENSERPLVKKSEIEMSDLYKRRLNNYLQSSDLVLNTDGYNINAITKLLNEEINKTVNN